MTPMTRADRNRTPTAAKIAPSPPKIRPALRTATLPADALTHEAVANGLTYEGLDMASVQAESIEIEQSRFLRVNLGAASLEQAVFCDVAFDGCDLVNMHAPDISLLRSTVTASRILGAAWPGGYIKDVTFSDCRGQLASFRAARLRTVLFTESDLRQVDFGQAELHGVRFVDCDLSGAQFSHATMKNVRFENCDLSGVGGATYLKGATVQGGDLLGLGQSLARDVGISIEV